MEDGGGAGVVIVLYVIMLAIALFTYIWFAYWTYKLAQQRGAQYAWFAWIPILQWILLWQISETETYVLVLLILGCFCTITQIIGLILIGMAIAEQQGEESWVGVLLGIPIANLFSIYKLANP